MLKSPLFWPVFAVAALAVGLRLHGLASVPLWTDEIFTRYYPDAGLDYLWGPGLRSEPTSPLYYTLIAAIERGVGPQPWALRLPSVLASLASIGLAGALGRELFGRAVPALLAALLLALAPTNILYAQEARAYALQAAALALALLGFARFLRDGSGLVAYGVGAVLAIWFHPTSVVAVAALNAGALAATAGRGRLVAPSALRRWVVANSLVFLSCLPLLPGMLWPTGGGGATSWIPPLSRWSLETVTGVTLAGPALVDHSQGIAEIAAVALAALVLVPPWRPDRRTTIVLVLVPGLALAAMIGISVVKPLLLSRTLAWFLVPLAVALGGVLSRRPVVVGVAVVATVAAGLAVQLGRGAALNEDWPALFAQAPDLAPPTLVVLAPHSPPGAVALYAPAVRDPVRLDDDLAPIPETTIMPRLFGTPTITAGAFATAIEAGRPVCLIYRRPEYEWVQRAIAALPKPARALQSEAGRNPALRLLCWSR